MQLQSSITVFSDRGNPFGSCIDHSINYIKGQIFFWITREEQWPVCPLNMPLIHWTCCTPFRSNAGVSLHSRKFNTTEASNHPGVASTATMLHWSLHLWEETLPTGYSVLWVRMTNMWMHASLAVHTVKSMLLQTCWNILRSTSPLSLWIIILHQTLYMHCTTSL